MGKSSPRETTAVPRRHEWRPLYRLPRRAKPAASFPRSLDRVWVAGPSLFLPRGLSPQPFLAPRETVEVTIPSEEKGLDPLPKLGQAIWESLPQVWRAAAIYTVDAIRDVEGRLWFLEVNFFPFIHP